jgi:hypothetical protein
MSHESEHVKPADQHHDEGGMTGVHGHASGEAEHAQHHAHDPFDKRVALSMVMIAAVLAGGKVLGHRAHNDTLAFRIQAGNLRTEASDLHTKADTEKTQASAASTKESNQWAYYQAKKLREHFYEVSGDMLRAQTNRRWWQGHSSKALAWKALSARYAKDTDEIRDKAESYAREEKACHQRAEKYDEEAEKKLEKAEKLDEKSEHMHHKGTLYDLGEMGVELALVVCSVAILTKRKEFWYGGIALGAVGAIISLIGLLH